MIQSLGLRPDHVGLQSNNSKQQLVKRPSISDEVLFSGKVKNSQSKSKKSLLALLLAPLALFSIACSPSTTCIEGEQTIQVQTAPQYKRSSSTDLVGHDVTVDKCNNGELERIITLDTDYQGNVSQSVKSNQLGEERDITIDGSDITFIYDGNIYDVTDGNLTIRAAESNGNSPTERLTEQIRE